MKKIILGIAVASFFVSCQKIQAGGNTGVLKMEEGAERYSDDVMSDEATAKMNAMQNVKAAPAMDSGTVSTQMEATVKSDSTLDVKAQPRPSTPENK